MRDNLINIYNYKGLQLRSLSYSSLKLKRLRAMEEIKC